MKNISVNISLNNELLTDGYFYRNFTTTIKNEKLNEKINIPSWIALYLDSDYEWKYTYNDGTDNGKCVAFESYNGKRFLCGPYGNVFEIPKEWGNINIHELNDLINKKTMEKEELFFCLKEYEICEYLSELEIKIYKDRFEVNGFSKIYKDDYFNSIKYHLDFFLQEKLEEKNNKIFNNYNNFNIYIGNFLGYNVIGDENILIFEPSDEEIEGIILNKISEEVN